MTLKQRELLADLQMMIFEMDIYYRQLHKKINLLSKFDDTDIADKKEFTEDEINRLISFNQRLAELELYLCNVGAKECSQLDERVADPYDPLDDYEIEAKLYFILNEDDSEFDEDEDNFLTQRHISLKRIDMEYGLGDNIDHRVPYRKFPGGLNTISHCWLFYDLLENSRGLVQPSITLEDGLRVDSIWVDIAIHNQATLDIESGKWIQPVKGE